MAKVHRTEFRELRNRAIAELKRLLDVVPKSVTKHFKNWCITQRRTDAMRRAAGELLSSAGAWVMSSAPRSVLTLSALRSEHQN